MTNILDILIEYANSIVCVFIFIIMINRIEDELSVYHLI